MKKGKIVCLLLVVVMVVSMMSFTGCRKPESEAGGDIDVGIVLPTKDESRWLQDEDQFTKKFKEANIKHQVVFSQGQSTTEKTNVESLIAKGIKVLIICPVDASTAAATVEQAQSKGIKVISYDRLITDTEAVDYYVTFDSLEVGKAQGKYLVDSFNGKKNVPLYLYGGAATDNNAFLFFEGAWSELQPKIADGTFVVVNSDKAKALQSKAKLERKEIGDIIGQVTTDWKPEIAKSTAETNLNAARPDDKTDVAILAPNDGTSMSIADTFNGKVKSYVITGQDADPAALKYILDGKQSMTVFKDTRKLVDSSVQMSKDLLENKKPDAPDKYDNKKKEVASKKSAIITITKDNLKKEIIDSGYYTEDKIK